MTRRDDALKTISRLRAELEDLEREAERPATVEELEQDLGELEQRVDRHVEELARVAPFVNGLVDRLERVEARGVPATAGELASRLTAIEQQLRWAAEKVREFEDATGIGAHDEALQLARTALGTVEHLQERMGDLAEKVEAALERLRDEEFERLNAER